MKRRARPDSRRPTTAPRDPEALGLLAAILRQVDHAADLVLAFLRGHGLLVAGEAASLGLPREFLLELGALLQLREWQAGGVIDPIDVDGLPIDERIGASIQRLHDDPVAVATGRSGTAAMVDMLRQWNESMALGAREGLGCDIALRWDRSIDVESLIDSFADFLCRHRDVPLTPEFE